jgi:hypothetical protein
LSPPASLISQFNQLIDRTKLLRMVFGSDLAGYLAGRTSA